MFVVKSDATRSEAGGISPQSEARGKVDNFSGFVTSFQWIQSEFQIRVATPTAKSTCQWAYTW